MRKFYVLSSLLLIVTLLHGCYSPPPPSVDPSSPYTIEVKVDKQAYHIGEFVVISVRASHDGYLTLYDISTQGEVTQIFPNRFAADNYIYGGKLYRIPTQSDAFDFEITGPPGVERVRAVGTIEDVNFFGERKAGKDEDFPTISGNSGEFDKSLSNKLNTMPAERWTEASVTFQVVP